MTRRSNSRSDPTAISRPSIKTWVLRGLGALAIVGIVGVGGLYAVWGSNLPSVSELDVLEFGGKTKVYDRADKPIGTLQPSLPSGVLVNEFLTTSDISSDLLKAVVTSEDRYFFKHNGVDFKGIIRGLFKGQGGSSITQQVVKNTLLFKLEGARTLERKFKEAILAVRVDQSFSKDRVLTAYLNVIYWGDDEGRRQIIGANMAARAYFKKQASQLTLAESVYLATLIPAPNRRNKQFIEYRPLMRHLLDRMTRDGKITKAQADQAWRTPIYPAGWRISWNSDGTIKSAQRENPKRLQSNLDETQSRHQNTYKFRSYLQAVEKELIPKIGRKALYAGGKIFTNMDVNAQRSAELASRQAQIPKGSTLGIALVDTKTGSVRALVGQKLTERRPNEWNNAIQARRQVGSSIKPLLYTLAIEKGWKQSDTVLDAPLKGKYQPKNHNGRWSGKHKTMRYSLNHSLNLTTVRIAQEIGLKPFVDKLRQMNFDHKGLKDPGLSLSLGTLEASPLQMAAAYAPFANSGVFHEPTTVRRVEDSNGASLYEQPSPRGRQIWDPQTAWIGLDMIRGVVSDLSVNARARISGWEVGGKTGTTNDVKDLWFVGVTPLISGAVWVGNENNISLQNQYTSNRVAAPIWQKAVSEALAKQPTVSFQEPQGITYQMIRQVKMALKEKQLNTPARAHSHDHQNDDNGLFRWFRRQTQGSQENLNHTQASEKQKSSSPQVSDHDVDPSVSKEMPDHPKDVDKIDKNAADKNTDFASLDKTSDHKKDVDKIDEDMADNDDDFASLDKKSDHLEDADKMGKDTDTEYAELD